MSEFNCQLPSLTHYKMNHNHVRSIKAVGYFQTMFILPGLLLLMIPDIRFTLNGVFLGLQSRPIRDPYSDRLCADTIIVPANVYFSFELHEM